MQMLFLCGITGGDTENHTIVILLLLHVLSLSSFYNGVGEVNLDKLKKILADSKQVSQQNLLLIIP